MAQLTVVIPTHDRPLQLARAVASVLDHADAPVEIIVVDDGSAPATAAPADERVTVVRHDRPAGPAAARNSGARHATSSIIAFLDDDDVWTPDRMARQAVAFANHSVDVVVFRTVNAHESVATTDAIDVENRPVRRLLRSQPPSLDGVAVRRSLHDEVEFDETFQGAEDLDYLLRLAQRASFAFVDHVGAILPGDGPATLVSLDQRIAARIRWREKHIAMFDRRADSFHWLRLGHLNRRAGHRHRALGCFARSVWCSPVAWSAWKGAVLTIAGRAWPATASTGTPDE